MGGFVSGVGCSPRLLIDVNYVVPLDGSYKDEGACSASSIPRLALVCRCHGSSARTHGAQAQA